MLPRTARPQTLEAPALPPAPVRPVGQHQGSPLDEPLTHVCPLATPVPDADRAVLDDLLRQAALLRTVAAVAAVVVLLAVLVVLMRP